MDNRRILMGLVYPVRFGGFVALDGVWGRHEDHPDQALAFAEAEGCDVVLTEIELWTERLGGIRLAKAVKEINPRVSIIFVTVCGEWEVAHEISDLQISGFLPKLWRSESLAAVFQNLRDPAKSYTTM